MFRTITHSSALALCLLAVATTGCDLGEFNGEIVPNPVVEPPPNATPQGSCGATCHGNAENPAPPNDTDGQEDPTLLSVGAHRAHLRIAPLWYQQIQCTECHQQVDNVGSPGHNDGNVDIQFGQIANGNGAIQAEWTSPSCGVYCHGVSMDGGLVTEPNWNEPGALTGCDACHGNPPQGGHPPSEVDNCGGCHQTVQLGGTTFLAPEKHINGIVETALDGGGGGGPGEPAQTCSACHGEGDVSAPPKANNDATEYTDSRVGAHRAHLGPSDWRREMFCSQCHEVPADVNAPGHMDDNDDQAEVQFDNLNPQANYNFDTYDCSNLYCHGNGYNQTSTESWVVQLELGCASCHDDGGNGGVNMSGAHDDHLGVGMACRDCHGQVVNNAGGFADPNLHINGVHEVASPNGTWDAAAQTCYNVGCHADFPWDNQ